MEQGQGRKTRGTTMSILQDKIAALIHAFPDSERKNAIRKLAAEVGALEERIRRVEKVCVPICVGRPIIETLARDGQWLSENGCGLIAASCLFQKNPYDEVDLLKDRIQRLEDAGDYMAYTDNVEFDCLVAYWENAKGKL